jgi:hypothetical protein
MCAADAIMADLVALSVAVHRYRVTPMNEYVEVLVSCRSAQTPAEIHRGRLSCVTAWRWQGMQRRRPLRTRFGQSRHLMSTPGRVVRILWRLDNTSARSRHGPRAFVSPVYSIPGGGKGWVRWVHGSPWPFRSLTFPLCVPNRRLLTCSFRFRNGLNRSESVSRSRRNVSNEERGGFSQEWKPWGFLRHPSSEGKKGPLDSVCQSTSRAGSSRCFFRLPRSTTPESRPLFTRTDAALGRGG